MLASHYNIQRRFCQKKDKAEFTDQSDSLYFLMDKLGFIGLSLNLVRLQTKMDLFISKKAKGVDLFRRA